MFRRRAAKDLMRLRARLPDGLKLRLPTARIADDQVLVANRIRSAAEILGAAVGAVYSADLLDSLFSKFCVGK